MARSLTAIVILASCVLALAACGGGKKTASPTATTLAPLATSPTTSTPAATGTPAATSTAFQGGRNPVEGSLNVSGHTPSPGELVDVGYASPDGYDRIAFKFSGDEPNYRVEYVSSPTQCGSGAAVPLTGQQAALRVRFTPANAHNQQGTATFGQTTVSPGLQSIVQAVQTCDFEADVTWVVILSQELDFRVTALSSPYGLVVDVAHP